MSEQSAKVQTDVSVEVKGNNGGGGGANKGEGITLGIMMVPGEIKDKNLWRAVFAEFVAMMMFLFFSLGMVTTTMGSFTGAFRLEIALAFGMTITVLVFIFGPISGANMNPAVSFGLMISKNISPIRMGLYWLAQLIGGIVGMACARALNADAYDTDNGSGKYNVGYGTVNYVRGLEGDSGAFLGEFLCTMFLMLTVMAAVENGTDERAHHTGSLAPFCIGLAVFLAHLVLIPYTGCSINPARSFAASVINGEFTDHWLFWIAPLMGSGVGVVVYEIIWKKRKDESL